MMTMGLNGVAVSPHGLILDEDGATGRTKPLEALPTPFKVFFKANFDRSNHFFRFFWKFGAADRVFGRLVASCVDWAGFQAKICLGDGLGAKTKFCKNHDF